MLIQVFSHVWTACSGVLAAGAPQAARKKNKIRSKAPVIHLRVIFSTDPFNDFVRTGGPLNDAKLAGTAAQEGS
jgi:hypothetical protein